MNKESKDCYIGERNGVISTLPDETDTTDAYVDVGKIDLLSPLMNRGYLTLHHINSKMPLEENVSDFYIFWSLIHQCNHFFIELLKFFKF